MAFELFNDGRVDNIGSVQMNGSWQGNNGPTLFLRFQWGYGSFTNQTSTVNSNESSGSYNRTPTVDKDRTIKFRPYEAQVYEAVGPSSGDFKTYADAALFDLGLTPGTPTLNTCPVSGRTIPKTTESFGDVYMEVRVQGTGTWFQNGGAIATGLSGDIGIDVSGTLSGLNPGTTYEARFRISRNTSNSQNNYSNIGTFTTQSSAAVVIAPPLMTSDEMMFVPSVLLGAGAVVISPATMEELGEMFVPSLVFSQEVVIEVFVTFNDIIVRSTTLG